MLPWSIKEAFFNLVPFCSEFNFTFNMKTLLTSIFIIITLSLSAQNGYLKTKSDSVITGYLKYYASANDGSPGIELWKTKNDKNPRRIPKSEIVEFAIKKDTFKVLHQYKPFTDSKTYYEIIDAERKSSGKINLYRIYNRQRTRTNGNTVYVIPDGSIEDYEYLYILEDGKTGFMKTIPSRKAKIDEALKDFFPERYIVKYAEVNGKIKYSDIPDLVKLYNSK